MRSALAVGLTTVPSINSDGIIEWSVRNVVPLILLVIGLGILAEARKGRLSENALTVTNVLLGCAVIAGAALFYGFGDDITTFIFAEG